MGYIFNCTASSNDDNNDLYDYHCHYHQHYYHHQLYHPFMVVRYGLFVTGSPPKLLLK